jgi:hypothetical protein
MNFAFGRPSCGGALRCVGAPNFRTYGRALRLRCRRALGRPTCRRALRCIGVLNLQTCLAFLWGAQLADVPCVAFGCPSCGRAFHCVGAANLGEAVLKTLPPSQNLFLSILQLVFYPSATLCGHFRCGSVFRLGAHLADAACIAFGRPSCRRAFRCIGVTNLRTCGRALRLRCGSALGHPTCGRALRYVRVPNLRTGLVLRLGTHLANVPCVALGRPTLVGPY